MFARMILDDPSLDGIAAVLFDEFHERSLDADLGLALALDAQGGLREDLRLLVMSATLDGARVARLLGDAPVVESEGRAYPVETRYLGRDPNRRIDEQVAEAVTRALRADSGSILVFLPGQGEIRRVETLLRERITDPAVDLAPLYGALERGEQDLAVSPGEARTAQGGARHLHRRDFAHHRRRARRHRFGSCPRAGLRAEYRPHAARDRARLPRRRRSAARSRGPYRAGGLLSACGKRPRPGRSKPFARPEILSADLAPLLLDCAAWGVTDPNIARLPRSAACARLEGGDGAAAAARRARWRGAHHG